MLRVIFRIYYLYYDSFLATSVGVSGRAIGKRIECYRPLLENITSYFTPAEPHPTRAIFPVYLALSALNISCAA